MAKRTTETVITEYDSEGRVVKTTKTTETSEDTAPAYPWYKYPYVGGGYTTGRPIIDTVIS